MSEGLTYYLKWPHTKRQHGVAAAMFFALSLLVFAVGLEVGGMAFFGVSLGMLARMAMMDDAGGVGVS